ncbi:MAG: hypothetical protein CMN32_00875 [Saprospirales bacterium]|nr:hypothetical protein [Saprospirales bacterium]
MKKWIFFALLISSITSTGQPGFNKTYGFEEEQITGSAFVNVLLDNDTLVLFGTCFPPVGPPGQQALLFVKMDTLGNVLLQKFYPDPDMDKYAASPNFEIIKTLDSGYMLTGTNINSGYGILVKLSFNGEIEFYRKYDPAPDLTHRPRKVLEVEDGYLISGHKSIQNYDIQVFLMKVDKQGNFLWEKTYGQPGVVDVMNSLVKISDNHFAIGAAKSKGLGEPPYSTSDTWSKGWLIQVDSLGNIISTQESPANTQAGLSGLKKMPDGWLFAAVEFKILNQFEWGARSKIVRTGVDISNVVWEKYISATTRAGNTTIDIKPTPDGNWVAVGQWATPIPPPPSTSPNYLGGSTFKFTSDGDSLWARLDTAFWHPDCGSENYLGGVAVLPSGSIIAAGYANTNCYPPTVRSWGWVLKISKDGCIDTLLCSGITPVKEVQTHPVEVKAWPNPATTHVDFFFQNPAGGRHRQLLITDLAGRPVQSFEIPEGETNLRWNTEELLPGVYFYQWITNGKTLKTGKILLTK